MTSFSIDQFWNDEFNEHQNVAEKTFNTLQAPFAKWLDLAEETIQQNRKILFFGNGGSAADAQHLATELTIRYKHNRPAIAALALTTDTSALTACGNDFGFDDIFSRQIEAIGQAGDLAIGISTSGQSPNVIKALQTARDMGIKTSGLSGKDGGKMPDLCDVLLIVPSETTARIQEMHITLGQMLCGALEHRLGYVS